MPSAIALSVAALLGVASAVPGAPSYGGSKGGSWGGTKQPQCKNFKEHNSNFEDVTGLPAVALQPIPQGYNGLYYQAFNLIDASLTDNLTLIPQVAPHSPNKYAGAGLQSSLLSGTPMLTTNYPNSQTASFSLESFYYGCVIAATSEFSVPTPCDVTVTGYRGNDNSVSSAQQVCSQQFQYNPTTMVGYQQQAFSGQVKGCDNIQFALIQYSPPGGLKATEDLQSLLLDDIKFSTCDK